MPSLRGCCAIDAILQWESTMRKRLLVAGSLAVLLVSALAVLEFVGRHDRISRATSELIREGMTLPEVENRLGGPEGLYTSDGEDWSEGMLHSVCRAWNHTRHVWLGDDGGIRIDFDEQGRVAETQWHPRRESLWERMRVWLRF
jgi:hypothetical protein